MSFLGEIKRRKIFQVAAVYAVVAWLLIQIVATIEEPLSLPDWVDTLVIVLFAVGFPITLIISWSFNLTSEGLTREVGSVAPTARQGRQIEYILIGLVVVALGWLVYRVEFDSGGVVGHQLDGVLPNTIAVLPFENLSLNPEDAFFAAGIHESTLNQLAKISGLIVLSRTSVMQYEENRPSIPEIAKVLNAAMIMEGSVRYANGRVLIAAQLIDGKTDAHLWSEEFNKELTDVFAVQAEVARQIASRMKLQLLPEEQARINRQPTNSAEAYQLFLKALSLNIRNYSANMATYLELLDQAIALDPEFAEAYAGLAWGHYFTRDRDIAVQYAQKAIELDPTNGTPYRVLGYVYGNYYAYQEKARLNMERAVELSPNDPEILITHAYRLGWQGRNSSEALQFAQRAVAIAPRRAGHRARLGYLYLIIGNLAAALEHTNEAIALEPKRAASYSQLAIIDYLNGNKNLAKENLDYSIQITPASSRSNLGYAAYLYGLLGDVEQAEVILARLENVLTPRQLENAEEYLCWAILGTRDKKRALQSWTTVITGYLEQDRPLSPGRIIRFRDNWLNDPMLDEPEFVELRRRLGFEG
jgi:TolB-like protein/Flp pilus assembly protein TadD